MLHGVATAGDDRTRVCRALELWNALTIEVSQNMVRPTTGTSVGASLAVVGSSVGGSSVVGPSDVGSLVLSIAVGGSDVVDASVVGSS